MRPVAPWFVASLCAIGCALLPLPVRALDGAAWERVLVTHARAGGFDYAGLARDPGARADLSAFLSEVASMPEDAPMSAWLNAYNALVVSSVVARWPLRSVRDVPGFFDGLRHRVAGRDRTLDEIEHGVLRARFRDARVHAALVCGARSCPPLFGHAFVEGELDRVLDELVRAWLAGDGALRITGGRVTVSPVFFWYRGDFEREAGSVVEWLRRRVPERWSAASIEGGVSEGSYDWALNAAP